MRRALACGMVIALALVSACSQKVPAEEAIAAAQNAFDAIKADAQVYVPDEMKAVEDAFAAVKGTFDAGNYEQAITDAKALLDQVNALKTSSEAKHKELADTWSQLSAALPPVVESIQARVTELSKMRRLPKEISTESFDAAKAGLDEITQVWTEATGAFEGGDLVSSVAKAEAVKAKAIEVMGRIGVPMPEGWQ